MELEDARIGTSVLVSLDYRKPHRKGAMGTIKKRYGDSDYRAFEVLFPDGQTDLFWDISCKKQRSFCLGPRRSGGGYSGSR